jgi:hypothetical protein
MREKAPDDGDHMPNIQASERSPARARAAKNGATKRPAVKVGAAKNGTARPLEKPVVAKASQKTRVPRTNTAATTVVEKAKKKAKKKRARRAMKDWPTAKTADRYALYQASVQDAVFEVDLLGRMYKAAFGKTSQAMVLREDFSGTGWVSCEWVRRDRRRESYAVDLDPTTHAWGRVHNLAPLDAQQKARVHWTLDDVRNTRATPKADIVAAMNFSYFIFKERAGLLEYFRSVYQSLGKQGLFALDIFGGSETFEDDREEEHGFEGFTYVWHQARHNPINGDYLFHIHFNFADGTKLEKAFTYDWRMWTLPEVKDILREAGFKKVDVYWEDSDKDGEGNGIYRIRTKGDADLAWVAYLVATK